MAKLSKLINACMMKRDIVHLPDPPRTIPTDLNDPKNENLTPKEIRYSVGGIVPVMRVGKTGAADLKSGQKRWVVAGFDPLQKKQEGLYPCWLDPDKWGDPRLWNELSIQRAITRGVYSKANDLGYTTAAMAVDFDKARKFQSQIRPQLQKEASDEVYHWIAIYGT